MRGYGYVEIEDSGFEKALKLDGVALDGRPLKVHAVTDEPVADDGGGSNSGSGGPSGSGNAEASGS